MKAITHSRWLVVTTVLGAALLPLQAGAEEAGQAATLRAGEVFGIAAVDSQDLAVSRGGAEVTNDLKIIGVAGNNTVGDNVRTGYNSVAEGSFSGASGFSTVVQNSGNNVLIQNATIINLQVQ